MPTADTVSTVGVVAVETQIGFDQPRVVARAATDTGEDPRYRPARSNSDIRLWEIHSELALVCPEVRERGLAALPERDPESFLVKSRQPDSPTEATRISGESLVVALFAYTLLRLGELARGALLAVGLVIALALLADAFH
jgi:hypothetical protein